MGLYIWERKVWGKWCTRPAPGQFCMCSILIGSSGFPGPEGFWGTVPTSPGCGLVDQVEIGSSNRATLVSIDC